jgi:hypothetical protein
MDLPNVDRLQSQLIEKLLHPWFFRVKEIHDKARNAGELRIDLGDAAHDRIRIVWSDPLWGAYSRRFHVDAADLARRILVAFKVRDGELIDFANFGGWEPSEDEALEAAAGLVAALRGRIRRAAKRRGGSPGSAPNS